jgi:DNA-binding LytR/AlgR family response regulator
MNCIIIEDQPPAQRILKKYIDDMGSLELKGTFSDTLEAMACLKTTSIDLMFLDIHLPKISGIDFLKSLPHPPHVILTTAFPDYALESYELDVVDYLLKPFSFQRFVKAIAKVPTDTTTPTRNELFIKSGYEYIKIPISDILYIKSDADYTEIYLDHKKYLSSESLQHWLDYLQSFSFYRIHKSYIVHLPKIEKISGNRVFLPSEHVLPIGRAYKEEFMRLV